MSHFWKNKNKIMLYTFFKAERNEKNDNNSSKWKKQSVKNIEIKQLFALQRVAQILFTNFNKLHN